VDRIEAGKWRVEGDRMALSRGPVDCGNAGRAGARLLMGAAAGFPIRGDFHRRRFAQQRPMERVLAPLRAMGARAEGDRLPGPISGAG
jgi:3-phosphoshikimate 1-carboxyvinyltransferase